MTGPSEDDRPIVIVGGAGFIGSNLASSFLAEGRRVVVVDSLARPGVETNLDWLAERHGDRLVACRVDVRDREGLASAVAGAGAVFHLAAQVAVTTSLDAPVEDFEVNAGGTLNLLEAVRKEGRDVPLVFASTNKVYGALGALAMSDADGRWRPSDPERAAHGLAEDHPLDFCTPYGCSKGAADQYVLDYAKSYGLRTAVLRMSCIYGPRQFGTEDQGWVAHFLIRALRGEAITIFGDGRQTRDILHVSDAVEAYRMVLDDIDRLKGRAFKLGGGPANAVCLNEVVEAIAALTERRPQLRTEPWRTGDQLWFVADTRALADATGWRPRVSWRQGLDDLARWLAEAGLATPSKPENRRLTA